MFKTFVSSLSLHASYACMYVSMFAIKGLMITDFAKLVAMHQVVSQCKARIHSKRILCGICGSL